MTTQVEALRLPAQRLTLSRIGAWIRRHLLSAYAALALLYLFLPIFVEGGLFSCGDGHGVQGDGEVCVTAIETALQGTFELGVGRAGLRHPKGILPRNSERQKREVER